MNRKELNWSIAAGTAVVAVVVLAGTLWKRDLPDFGKIRDIDERKEAFFSYLHPYVRKANQRILDDRVRLQLIEKKIRYGALNKRDIRWLLECAESHGLVAAGDEPELDTIARQLENRMDRIPASLALAQAALESAWGTSRFARKGNNLFGIRCYTPGCGIIPHNRSSGADYEVTAYRSTLHCLQHYLLVLNRNPEYRLLWQLRREARETGNTMEGTVLAGGLRSYSEEGDEYIRKVRRVISENQLQRYD